MSNEVQIVSRKSMAVGGLLALLLWGGAVERARAEDRPYDAVLYDLAAWDKAKPEKQDEVIAAVAKALGEAFKHTETKVYECGGQKHRIASFRHEKTKATLNLIPGATFKAGQEKEWKNAGTEVRVPPLLVGRRECSVGEWKAMGGKPLSWWKSDDQVAAGEGRVDVVATIKKAGDGLRLPSEVEWEYAYRAGTDSKYFWGESFSDGEKFCWSRENSAGENGRRSKKVTLHQDQTNAFGLSDIAGNVWEMCLDSWIKEYKIAGHKPRVKKDATGHAMRGGGYLARDKDHYSATGRDWCPKNSGVPNIGFRLVRSIP